jgi:hypothetical protein
VRVDLQGVDVYRREPRAILLLTTTCGGLRHDKIYAAGAARA